MRPPKQPGPDTHEAVDFSATVVKLSRLPPPADEMSRNSAPRGVVSSVQSRTGMTPLFVPADLESDVILRDGTTVRLRPSCADDAAEALRFLEGLSAESLYNRFLMTPHLDLARARASVDVDQSRQVVLVAERAGSWSASPATTRSGPDGLGGSGVCRRGRVCRAAGSARGCSSVWRRSRARAD